MENKPLEKYYFVDGTVEADAVEIKLDNGFSIKEYTDAENNIVALTFCRDGKEITIAGENLDEFLDLYWGT